jgi:epoxyqueuosine reductase
VCQEVCPWNAAAPARSEPAPRLTASDLDHALPDLARLANLGSNQFRQFVKRTALRRIARPRLQRNVAIALGNSARAEALASLVTLLASPSSLARSHAAWGVGQLAATVDGIATAAAAALTAARAIETDRDVIAELDLAMARSS